MNLEKIAARLIQLNATIDEAEKEREEKRQQFFDGLTEIAQDEPLAQEVVIVSGCPSESEAKDAALKQHPGYLFRSSMRLTDTSWKILLEEDPAYKSYEFEGLQRQVVVGSPMLDDDRLKKEQPELWEAITYVPKPEPILKPLEDLSSAQLAALQDYIYYAKPQLRLRKVKKTSE